MSQKRGFTLIELLVVIAVIGILASSVIIGLSRAQTRARDAARKSDLDQVRKALETYLIDKPSGYPKAATSPQTIIELSALGTGGTAADPDFVKVLDGVAIPADPRSAEGSTWTYKYINNYWSSGTTWALTGTTEDRSSYTVFAHLESPKAAPSATTKAKWWHVNSKGASTEVEMLVAGSGF